MRFSHLQPPSTSSSSTIVIDPGPHRQSGLVPGGGCMVDGWSWTGCRRKTCEATINKSCGARGRIHHHHHHLLRLHLQPQLDWFCHQPSARGTANTSLAGGGHHLPPYCACASHPIPSLTMTIKNIFFVSPMSRTVHPDHPFIHDLPIVLQRPLPPGCHCPLTSHITSHFPCPCTRTWGITEQQALLAM